MNYKKIDLEELIYILIGIFLLFLFRRGGDSKYRIAICLIPLCFYYSYKLENFKMIKKYKSIYLSSFLYLVMLGIIFIFSKNRGGERIDDLLGMSFYSIVLFLALINIKIPIKIYEKLIPIITVLSFGCIERGLKDIYLHREYLDWYRVAGETYTTIYAAEIGLFFIFGFLAIQIYKNKYIKFFYVFYTMITLLIIYHTKSRNAMLMLPVTLTIIYFIKNTKKGIIAIVMTVLLIVFLIKNPLEINGINRLSSISNTERIKKDARVHIFREGIMKGKENLLLGEGFYKHKDDNKIIHNQPHYHNIIVETFATQGIITLIFYILFLINIFVWSLKNYFNEKKLERRGIKLIAIGVFIFLMLYGMAEPIFYFNKIYMLLFFILSLNFIEVKEEE